MYVLLEHINLLYVKLACLDYARHAVKERCPGIGDPDMGELTVHD